MHHLKLKAAVDKYGTLSGEELYKALADDKKGYTADEINEITAAIFGEPPAPPKVEPKKESKWYQKWRVEKNKKGEYEKLKMERPCVKISDHYADVLNEAAKSSPAGPVFMYFKD